MSRAVDGCGDDDRTEAEDALERYGAVYAGSSSSRGAVHPHPKCRTLNGGRNHPRQITHPAGIPLRVTDVCAMCERSYIDDDDNLLAHDGTDQFEPWTPTEYDCEAEGCDASGVVKIEHPEYGEVAMCAVHQRRHPVVSVLVHGAKYKDAAWLQEQYTETGRSISDIADECGVSKNTIHRWLDKHGIATAYRLKGPHNDTEWLREQYVGKTRSLRDIADKCGVGRDTIWERMKEHGIERRNPGGSACRSEGRYNDPEWLREQYVGKTRPLADIADECDVSKSTIWNRMDEFGIERRRHGGAREGNE